MSEIDVCSSFSTPNRVNVEDAFFGKWGCTTLTERGYEALWKIPAERPVKGKSGIGTD